MKINEIRSKSRTEIVDEIDGCSRELLNLRFQWQAGEVINSALYQKTRKNKAKLLTVLNEIDKGINKDLYQNSN